MTRLSSHPAKWESRMIACSTLGGASASAGRTSVTPIGFRRHRIRFPLGVTQSAKAFGVHFFWGRRTAPHGCVSFALLKTSVRARSRGSSAIGQEHTDHFVTVRFLFRHLFPPFGIGTISVPFLQKGKESPQRRYATGLRGRCREGNRHQNGKKRLM